MPLTVKWMDKLWFTHIRQYHSAVRMNYLQIMLNNMKYTYILSKRIQTPVIPFTANENHRQICLWSWKTRQAVMTGENIKRDGISCYAESWSKCWLHKYVPIRKFSKLYTHVYICFRLLIKFLCMFCFLPSQMHIKGRILLVLVSILIWEEISSSLESRFSEHCNYNIPSLVTFAIQTHHFSFVPRPQDLKLICQYKTQYNFWNSHNLLNILKVKTMRSPQLIYQQYNSHTQDLGGKKSQKRMQNIIRARGPGFLLWDNVS